MKRTFVKIFLLASAAAFIVSCGSGASTKYEEMLTLYCYAKADSTIDSLYLSRTGGVNESICLDNLGVSGAAVTLYGRSPSESGYTLIGTLSEYPDRKGIYYLNEADFPAGFRSGYSYRLEADHPDYDAVHAESVCPDELPVISVTGSVTGAEMVPYADDPSAVDTLYYRRGESLNDVEMMKCRFDSLLIIAEQRMASFRIVPDEICRIDSSFWLEDTTETVWDDYPAETQIFKDKDRYGKDIADYYLRSMPLYWYMFYHEGMHTVVFSATDRAFRSFMESLYGGEERYTNVVGGLGLFTISNSSAAKSRYRVYVRSLESKYP